MVNAARGVAIQVNNAVQGFVLNFMTAINPQITKSYASGNKEYMYTLIFQGARLSFYMLLILSLPILFNTEYILGLWLHTIPEHSVLFVQLLLIFALSESISNPLVTAMLATGNIRNYQIIVGGLQMLNLPVSYIMLKFGYFPEIVVVIAILISQLCLYARLILLRRMIGLPVKKYLSKVYMNIIIVSLTSAIIPIFVTTNNINNGFTEFLFISFITIICTLLSIYFVGCSKSDKEFVNQKIKKVYNKISRK